MSKFLLDANLSPETQVYLEKTFGFDVIDLITQKQFALSDEEIVILAKEQKRVIITFDLDFGEIYHLREEGKLGVIILRLDDQTVESVNRSLKAFFNGEAKNISLETSLVVLEKDKIRVVREKN